MRNLREHIDAVLDWLRAPGDGAATSATSDAGWSRLWAGLADVPALGVALAVR